MLDADRDGIVSFDDFRTKIWNLRWFIDTSGNNTNANNKGPTGTGVPSSPRDVYIYHYNNYYYYCYYYYDYCYYYYDYYHY